MRTSGNGSHEGLHPNLLARTRRADRTARIFAEFRAVTAEDIKQTPAHWEAADDTSGFSISNEGVVRLIDGTDVLVSHGSSDDYFEDLDELDQGGNGVDPWNVIWVEWSGTNPADVEVKRIDVTLNPRVNSAQTREVRFWKLRTYVVERVLQETPNEAYDYLIRIREVVDPISVDETGEAEHAVTFTYPEAFRPGGYLPENPKGLYGVYPITFFRVTAHKANGEAAANTGLAYDTGTASAGSGPTLTHRDLRHHPDAFGGRNVLEDFGTGGSLGTPEVSLEAGDYTSDDLEFTHPGNWLDLNGAKENLVQAPDDLSDTAAWGVNRASISANAATAPDGEMTADKIVEDNTAGNHTATTPPGTGPGFVIAAGERVRCECTLEQAGRTKARVQVSHNLTGFYADVDLDAGTIDDTDVLGDGGTLLSSSIQAAGEGLYHIALEGTLEALEFAFVTIQTLDATGTASYTGDGTSGIHVWRVKFIRDPVVLDASADLVLSTHGGVPSGTTLQGQIRNDADTDWVSFDDGDSFADLSLTATVTRKVRVQFTADAGGVLTPHLTYLAMEEIVTVDLAHVADVESYSSGVDPIECKGEITEVRLRAVKDGARDYRSTIEDVLAMFHLRQLTLRLWWGDDALDRDEWMLKGDYLVTDFIPGDPDVTIVGLSPLVLVRDLLPPYSPGERLIPEDELGGSNWTDHAGGSTHMEEQLWGTEPDETTFVQSPLDPTNEAISFRLSVPQLDTDGRRIIIEYRFRKDTTAGEQIDLQVQIQQGTTDVATNLHSNIGAAWEGASFEVDLETEGPLLTDSTDWRLEFIANGNASTPTRRAQVCWAQVRMGGKREAVLVDNLTPEQAVDDFIQNRLEVPARYWGSWGDAVLSSSHTLFKELFPQTHRLFERENITSKTEVDGVFMLVGGALIDSQGRLKGVDLFGSKPVVAQFHASEVTILNSSPGFESAIPEYFVPYDYSETRGGFEAEARGLSGARENLPLGRLEGPRVLDEEVAKYIQTQTLADEIVERMTTHFGPGFIQIEWESTMPYPELEAADLVSVPIDQFVARDPLTGQAVRGNLRALTVITKCFDVEGYRFRGWVRSFSDFVGVKQEATRLRDENPAKAREITVAFPRFTMASSSQEWTLSESYATPGTISAVGHVAIASIDRAELPDGVAITGFAMRYAVDDASGADGEVHSELNAISNADGTVVNLVLMAKDANDGDVTPGAWATEEAAVSHVVNWDLYHYQVWTRLRAALIGPGGVTDNAKYQWSRVTWR